MPSASHTATTADLLQHGRWLRRLATDLVGTGEAEDLVQQTYAAALAAPPTVERPLRPWLSKVMRNALSMDRRARIRRQRRETVAADPPEAEGDAEALLGRAQSLRVVAEAVESLSEPYRSTVFLRYLEEVPIAAIAQREGVAAATIRWRTKEALEMLRVDLDQRNGGDRQAWVVVLTPVVAPDIVPGAASTSGALAVKLSTKTIIIIAAATAVVALGLGTFAARSAAERSSEASAIEAPVTAQRNPVERRGAKDPAPPARALARSVRRFESPAQRRATVERLLNKAQARAEGGGAEATDDERFADVIDEMLAAQEVTQEFLLPSMHECFDALPADARGSLTMRMHVAGAPDIGAVIANSEFVDDLSSSFPAEVLECAIETGYALDFPPPPVAGSARIELSIAFDKAEGGFFARLGAVTPATPDERVYAALGPDGDPQLYRKPSSSE